MLHYSAPATTMPQGIIGRRIRLLHFRLGTAIAPLLSVSRNNGTNNRNKKWATESVCCTQVRSSSSVSGGVSLPSSIRIHVTREGEQKVSFAAPTGLTLMEAIRDVGKIDIEAACDGTCACSTCHVILRDEDYKKLNHPSDDEMDMLDLAPTVTATSRLSCQITLSEDLDGITVQLPTETENQLK